MGLPPVGDFSKYKIQDTRLLSILTFCFWLLTFWLLSFWLLPFDFYRFWHFAFDFLLLTFIFLTFYFWPSAFLTFCLVDFLLFWLFAFDFLSFWLLSVLTSCHLTFILFDFLHLTFRFWLFVFWLNIIWLFVRSPCRSSHSRIVTIPTYLDASSWGQIVSWGPFTHRCKLASRRAVVHFMLFGTVFRWSRTSWMRRPNYSSPIVLFDQ